MVAGYTAMKHFDEAAVEHVNNLAKRARAGIAKRPKNGCSSPCDRRRFDPARTHEGEAAPQLPRSLPLAGGECPSQDDAGSSLRCGVRHDQHLLGHDVDAEDKPRSMPWSPPAAKASRRSQMLDGADPLSQRAVVVRCSHGRGYRTPGKRQFDDKTVIDLDATVVDGGGGSPGVSIPGDIGPYRVKADRRRGVARWCSPSRRARGAMSPSRS